jgi:hypothetical protein
MRRTFFRGDVGCPLLLIVLTEVELEILGEEVEIAIGNPGLVPSGAGLTQEIPLDVLAHPDDVDPLGHWRCRAGRLVAWRSLSGPARMQIRLVHRLVWHCHIQVEPKLPPPRVLGQLLPANPLRRILLKQIRQQTIELRAVVRHAWDI